MYRTILISLVVCFFNSICLGQPLSNNSRDYDFFGKYNPANIDNDFIIMGRMERLKVNLYYQSQWGGGFSSRKFNGRPIDRGIEISGAINQRYLLGGGYQSFTIGAFKNDQLHFRFGLPISLSKQGTYSKKVLENSLFIGAGLQFGFYNFDLFSLAIEDIDLSDFVLNSENLRRISFIKPSLGITGRFVMGANSYLILGLSSQRITDFSQRNNPSKNNFNLYGNVSFIVKFYPVDKSGNSYINYRFVFEGTVITEYFENIYLTDLLLRLFLRTDTDAKNFDHLFIGLSLGCIDNARNFLVELPLIFSDDNSKGINQLGIHFGIQFNNSAIKEVLGSYHSYSTRFLFSL